MKHLGLKRTPVYLHPAGRVRMRDVITKGHKARERRTVAAEIEDQIAKDDSREDCECGMCTDWLLQPENWEEWQTEADSDLVDPAIWPRITEYLKTLPVVEEDEGPDPEYHF